MSKEADKIRSARKKTQKIVGFRCDDVDYKKFEEVCSKSDIRVSEALRYFVKNFKG